jgi:hypothetical protein
MRGSTARAAKLTMALLTTVTGLAVLAGSASASEVVYNDIPANFQSPPGVNAPPYSFEFYKTAQFGAQVGFGGTARKNPKITVIMGSNSCQSGSGASCATSGGAKFQWPVTFKVYSVGPENSVGTLLATGSKTFKIPYRPGANLTKCTGTETGDWYAKGECISTPKAFKVTLPLKVAMPLLPEDVIVSFSYNTTNAGEAPTHESGPYDGLSIAVTESASSLLTTGSNPALVGEPGGLYVNSSESYLYCVSPPPVGTFALTGLPCGWNNNAILMSVSNS